MKIPLRSIGFWVLGLVLLAQCGAHRRSEEGSLSLLTIENAKSEFRTMESLGSNTGKSSRQVMSPSLLVKNIPGNASSLRVTFEYRSFRSIPHGGDPQRILLPVQGTATVIPSQFLDIPQWYGSCKAGHRFFVRVEAVCWITGDADALVLGWGNYEFDAGG